MNVEQILYHFPIPLIAGAFIGWPLGYLAFSLRMKWLESQGYQTVELMTDEEARIKANETGKIIAYLSKGEKE